MTIELTGEKLTERFFVKVLGWKKPKDQLGSWQQKTHDGYPISEHTLPPLHTSLDLQEFWVWPELLKLDYYHSEFIQYLEPTNFVCCELMNFDEESYFHKAPTKVESQLGVALKVLAPTKSQSQIRAALKKMRKLSKL